MSGQSYQHPAPGSGQVCRETSGFLFSHACEQLARYACQRCGKPICAQHVSYQDDDEVCIACSKLDPLEEDSKGVIPPVQPQYDPNPYWYAQNYYDDYSWRHDDFNEADESVMIGNEDIDAEWENDMGAS